MPETTPERSALMKKVRQAGTDAEMAVRRALRAVGAHYRVNVRDLPGRPDIASKSRKLAIFVHGCFWHGHQDCPKHRLPKANREFWAQKFEANIARDRAKLTELEKRGFKTLVVWECEIKDQQELEQKLRDFWYGSD